MATKKPDALELEKEQERRRRVFHAKRVFTPSAPIDQENLFAGRAVQRERLIDAIVQKGKHAILYGERGVGKTSLAKIMSPTLEKAHKGLLAPFVTCDDSDDFSSIWMKIFYEIQQEAKVRHLNFNGGEDFLDFVTTDPETKGGIVPDDVRIGLSIVAKELLVIVIIDEFDQIKDQETKKLFSNTIKTLSDHSVDATIILTGVAGDVTELIEYHQSIQRCLVYIQMPRMREGELREFVEKALAELDMEIDDDALGVIIWFSRGFAHFTHALGQAASIRAIGMDSARIAKQDVLGSLVQAIEELDPIIRATYRSATLSSQSNLFQEVLLACALADFDEMGFFSPADIMKPLCQILGRDVTIASYSSQLHDFCEPKRGKILEKIKIGNKKRFKFRFQDPFMQPYIILDGYEKKLIGEPSPPSSPTEQELPF